MAVKAIDYERKAKKTATTGGHHLLNPHQGRKTAETAQTLCCLVAGSIDANFSRSLTDFREIDGQLDAVVRYEVETSDRATV